MRTSTECGEGVICQDPGPTPTPYPGPSLPGSVKNVLLLVLLGVQNHHHTAGEKEENVPKLRGVLGFKDDSVPNRREPTYKQGSLGAKDSLSGHLLFQVFMLRILGHFTLLLIHS